MTLMLSCHRLSRMMTGSRMCLSLLCRSEELLSSMPESPALPCLPRRPPVTTSGLCGTEHTMGSLSQWEFSLMAKTMEHPRESCSLSQVRHLFFISVFYTILNIFRQRSRIGLDPLNLDTSCPRFNTK